MAIQQKPTSGIGDPISIRTIALEEHFTTVEYLRATAPFTPALATAKPLEEKLLDLGRKRIAAMDEGGVDFQVLSLAATAQDKLSPADATVLVAEANDAAFAATERHPGRLGMFSSLALRDPTSAAKELERGVLKQRSLGGFVNGTEGGSFLDDPRYTPLLEAAEALDVPLYLHPTPAPEAVQAAYFSGLPEASAYFLSTAAWGWHAELGLHALRLIVAGVFDRFPRLRFIIGHMGEGLPFSLMRAQDGLPQSVTGLKHSVAEAFRAHFVITTSGYFTYPPFLCAQQVLGVERILYSVDYPYRSNTAGARFLEGLPLPPDDLRKIASGNAERILRLNSR
jgi:predicted TIM-barrel fold metal-dependent hydrolase